MRGGPVSGPLVSPRPAGRGKEGDPLRQVLDQLDALADPSRLGGMARYGIAVDAAMGVSIPELRGIARKFGTSHALALRLWETGIHEARVLASLVDDPKEVTPSQMDAWVRDFDSWDLCDQVCSNLFDRTGHAFRMAIRWAGRRDEFVRRAGFATMAAAAVHRRDVTTSRSPRFCRSSPRRPPTSGTT
ncbi:MAG: DNA alkylation repair protein [Actinomycetota bacterium]